MLPDTSNIGYAAAAEIYWEAGWRGVLPLKRGSKWPPPQGFTGYNGAEPSYADILQWAELYADGNLCLRLPDGVIGVDVDAYGAKTGAAAFAEAVKRWGPLPEGPQSSSRGDDLVSGLRLFRVPPGTLLETVIVFPELSIGDIEIIQRHHRYVVCWPSLHPEGRDYYWRNSAGQLLGIPMLDDIPLLPQAWIDGLKLTPRSLDVSAEFDTRRALTSGEPSPLVQARLADAIKEMNLPGMSRHDTCLRHVMAILRMGAEGQAGVESALSLLREVFIAVLADPSRGDTRPRDVAFSEFNRMVSNGNVARELSQPGILDWFRQVMESGGDLGAQIGNGAEAAEVTADSDDTGQPRQPVGELEAIEQDFWTAREANQVIYQAALARMGAPWAVFAACVARVLALVPPTLTLPPIIGGRGSLNWYGVVVAESGGGKGTAMSVAAALVTGDVDVRPIGSGEGMIECYNRKGDDPQTYVTSVMFDVPEIDTIGVMGDRSGQTTSVVLRNGFSGERLGFTYRGRTGSPVEAHTYRMTMLVGAQPTRAGSLLEDGGGGTTQRMMWFPGMDRRVVADPTPYPADGLGMDRTLNGLFPRQWEMLNAVGTIVVPPEVETEIRETRAAFMRKEVDGVRGHALYAQEKVAFALAYMDGRTEIDLEDWRLAKIVSAVSDWTLRRVTEAFQESRLNEFRDRGVLKGAEHAAAERSKAAENLTAFDRVKRNLLKKVDKLGGASGTDLVQSIHSRDRFMAKGALDWLAGEGILVLDEDTKMWVRP